MQQTTSPPEYLSKGALRRKSIKLAYVNAALWSIGNGLTSGTLLYYLALDLGAKGLTLSLILAMPALVGLLRMSTPWLVARCGSAKRACIYASFLSYLLLWVWVCAIPSPEKSSNSLLLGSLIAAVCVHQLLEYIAHAALYAWLADIVPVRVRGRFFGRRNMWQIALLIPTSLAGGYFAQAWKAASPESSLSLQFLAYTIPMGVGSVVLLTSLVPLLLIPAVTPSATVAHVVGQSWRSRFSQLALPLRDGRFRTLLAYRAWFSVSNGLTQAAQNIFPRAVLSMEVGDMALMRTAMQFGQLCLSPIFGRSVDRCGNRPILEACQIITATGLLFFLVASPDSTLGRWTILGAFLLWSAYAGTNVAIYNLMLKLTPPKAERSQYVAAHEATGSIFYAASTVIGGLLLDYFSQPSTSQIVGLRLTPFAVLFGVGFLLRLGGLVLLRRIDEPGTARWSELAARRRRRLIRWIEERKANQTADQPG